MPTRLARRLKIGVTVALLLLWLVWLYARVAGLPLVYVLSADRIVPDQGFGYVALTPKPWLPLVLSRDTDRVDASSGSRARLFENGVPLRGYSTPHETIRSRGRGAYSDWAGGWLYFSASDNSDPRTNGRRYELRDRYLLKPNAWKRGSAAVALVLLALWGPGLWKSGRARIAVVRQAGELPWMYAAGRRRFAAMATLAVAAGVTAAVAGLVSGAAFWIAGFAALILGVLALLRAIVLAGSVFGFSWRLAWGPNLALVIGTVGLCLAVFEAYLGWLESEALSKRASGGSTAGAERAALADDFRLPPELVESIRRRKQLLSLPPEWENKPIKVPGATAAYSWHGITHVLDESHFRRLNGPFPARRPDTMRVVVVGDSMTYGAGIAPEWTYTAQLERRMKRNFRIEFINLGVNGAQSEDIARILERMLPILTPDLVIYGVCYNDFLPSGIGQYDHGYTIPLPAWLRELLLDRTRAAGFIKDGYFGLLLAMGISLDFYDDILNDFDDYQKRFAADVKRMDDLVRSAALPPVIGMPLDQMVKFGGRGHRISQVAERLMAEAGFDVVSMESFYRRYDGHRYFVSRWEGHPDEEANAIFAVMLFEHLHNRPDVRRFRHNVPATSPSG